MPLAPEARLANLEKSLVAWIQAKLVTTAGLSVFYAGASIGDRPNEWVHVDFLWGLRRDFGRQIDRTQLGSQVHSILQLSLAKKRAIITNLYSMAVLRDKVVAAFHVTQAIPLRDYDTGGAPLHW